MDYHIEIFVIIFLFRISKFISQIDLFNYEYKYNVFNEKNKLISMK